MAPRRREVGESSNRRVPRVDTMGLVNLSNDQKIVWERLTKPGRQIQETRFAKLSTLTDLGLRRPVQVLLSKVGLDNFLGYEANTYERYTLEFLATLEKGENEDGPFISFNLNDENHIMNYQEVMEAFGWNYTPDESYLSPDVYNEGIFYAQVTNGSPYHPRVKNSSLPHPALRFVHRFLSMTVFCHGEPTNLPRSDLRYLWTMTPEGVGCPDWVEIFVDRCLELARRDKGKISMGGMVTLLAEYLQVSVPTDGEGYEILDYIGNHQSSWPVPISPSNVYNVEQLKKANMLWVSPSNPNNLTHYVWLFGANRVKYMRLPQRARTQITPATTNAQLYIPPDEQYRAGVEEELGRQIQEMQQQQEQQQEDVPMEEMQPQQQQQQQQHHHQQQQPHFEPQQPSWQPFEDPYAIPVWHSMIESRMDAFETTQHNMELRLDNMQGHMDSMQGHMDSMEDHMYSMSSMMSAMNQFYISHYPEYRDPTQEIEERRLERQRHRSQRRYGGGQGPSGSH